jgi:hypothetical protein
MKWYPAAAAYWAEMVASAVGLLSTGRLFSFFSISLFWIF